MIDRLLAPHAGRGAVLRLLFGAALASAWLAACGGAAATTTVPAGGAGSSAAGDASHGGGAPTQSLPRLSTKQLAGARVIYAYAGLRPPASLLSQIRHGDVGGVIFFGSNVSSLAQIHGVVGRLQAAAKVSPTHLPLLLMTDQEGGQVRRLPGAPVKSEKQIGEQRNATRAASRAGTGAGRLLASVGMNVNLAPVLDVYRTAGDFDDQFQRSYSSDPAKVARLGSAFVRAQQRTGVAATVKHFPGLGAASASQNTDERPVTLHVPLSQLRSIDERPFQSAVGAGTKLVMTSWAVYPALDRSRPAGLSSKVIGGELRTRLGFKGATITDSIDAGALEHYGGLGNRAVLAARAGADLILCSQPSSGAQGSSVVRALAHAISTGTVGRSATRAAVSRILALRRHP
ncbi:MAG TPA: glycoside hydrolase family 3 N-terminal domain-containing protein [Solirubrobacteraceae bacterium]|nr:glycoside hydrolase family 3 N-terminal domain-containing protein [Solirubrobacteraceae bacterium]